MILLEEYIKGWRSHDTEAILATLDPDCTVIESFGPIYRGHVWVKRWIAEWIAEDGHVLEWVIHDRSLMGDLQMAEWTFHYTLRGKERRFDGATIARLREGKIFYLREYATTETLFDWKGKWR